MRLELTARNIDITPALRRLVDVKLAKLGRLLNDSAVSAQAVLTREKYRHRTEITIHTRGEKFLHGVGTSSAWETSVAEAIEKLTQQAQKVKGKWQERKRRRTVKGEPIIGELREAAVVKPAAGPRRADRVRARMPPILRASRQAIKPMSVAEAAREITSHRDGLVVFRDTETARLTVLYRRPNGELALVETES